MTIGSPEVIGLLEAYLEAAKNNRFGHVAISLVGHPNIAAYDFAGDISLELSQREALSLLDARVRRSIDNWTFPPQNTSLDASYVRYNIANGPLGYDFLIWLVAAEMTRVREGAPSPLRVGFWVGNDRAHANHDRRQLWLDRVFRPLLPCIGAVEDPAAIYGRCDEFYVAREIVAAARRGERVPRLRSPREWTGKKNHVTITLREAEHGQSRNSNIAEWLKVATALKNQGESIVFVRDTAKAHEPLPGFVTYPEASIDLHARLALYENSKVNMFVSNGPSGLALFGARPFLSFQAPDSGGGDEICNTPVFWEKYNGIKMGEEQYPWCSPQQRIICLPDTFDNIMAAWHDDFADSLAA